MFFLLSFSLLCICLSLSYRILTCPIQSTMKLAKLNIENLKTINPDKLFRYLRVIFFLIPRFLGEGSFGNPKFDREVSKVWSMIVPTQI